MQKLNGINLKQYNCIYSSLLDGETMTYHSHHFSFYFNWDNKKRTWSNFIL